jgi:hypothetical protein
MRAASTSASTSSTSLFDYIAVSADLTDRVIEYVDHLHEHFRHPVVMQAGCYLPPEESRLQRRDHPGERRRVLVSGR